jgi:dephospho-CoA kinase
MRVFGLTGGIGSGKSTVARMFREEGFAVLDADLLAREVIAPGTPAYGEIVRKYGKKILLPDGRIDRKALGETVFSDPAKRADLEAITHPAIAYAIREGLDRLRSEGFTAAIVEAALIHEAGRRGFFEGVIAVRCDPDSQLRRITERDGLSADQARRRIRSQMDAEEKARASDYVVDNSGSLEETRAQVRRLAARLLS